MHRLYIGFMHFSRVCYAYNLPRLNIMHIFAYQFIHRYRRHKSVSAVSEKSFIIFFSYDVNYSYDGGSKNNIRQKLYDEIDADKHRQNVYNY